MSKNIFLSTVILLNLLATPVIAIGKPDTLPGKANTLSPTPTSERLAPGKLKSCQAKEKTITKRMASLVKLVSNLETNFDAIAQRNKDYYTTTVLPSGKTLTNYDTLLSKIKTDKEAVETALNTAKTNSAGFNCTTDNPKKLLKQFETDMRAVKKALQTYKTSVKNLVVAVHSLTGTTAKVKPSVSPESAK